ncbi:MAG: response regulator [candidate division Zixibacteria bacterium]|jgi:signal transduction histidine kinase/CheY-like chemotaxis protein|nr:response regulator [candidate division Zixibacteria bacterium]
MNDVNATRYRVLVVDDEDVVVSLVRDALEDEGVDVEGALSGPDALARIEHHSCDLIITDIRMPGMDGIELVSRVRERYPDVAVIFMTGYANLNSAKDAIKQGASDYIMKPFELNEIRQAVRKALDSVRQAAELSQTAKLNHLSDLNQVLFTANDRSSLITSSLQFAMLHQKAPYGSIVVLDGDGGSSSVITVAGDGIGSIELPGETAMGLAGAIERSRFERPAVIGSLYDLSLFQGSRREDLAEAIRPQWLTPGVSAVAVPVRRAGDVSALMLLGFPGDTVTIREADLTFLSITATQLAMSLENLSLLDETRQAYRRLKELQDETIELEKMATRGQLSAEIGHELNNFLGVVAGNLSLLEFNVKKQKFDDVERYISTMCETIEKMKRFTGNLMDLRIGSSTREILLFDQTIQEVIDYLRPQKRFRDVSIFVTQIDEHVPFEADSTQILQLLYNLFNNAADATLGCERREITVRLEKKDDSRRFRFAISDTGVGFPEDILRKAFNEKFTTKKTGHGFGLVVCRRIVDQHGGTVHVHSQTGQGATIVIEFPMAVVETVPA